MDLSRLFHPRSIAVVGATDNGDNYGSQTLLTSPRSGSPASLGRQPTPRPRRTASRASRRCRICRACPTRSSSRSRPRACPAVIEEAGALGCGGAVVYAAGFREAAAGRPAPLAGAELRDGGAPPRAPRLRSQLRRPHRAPHPRGAVGGRARAAGAGPRRARVAERQPRRQRARDPAGAAAAHGDLERQRGGADDARLPRAPGRRAGGALGRAADRGRRRRRPPVRRARRLRGRGRRGRGAEGRRLRGRAPPPRRRTPARSPATTACSARSSRRPARRGRPTRTSCSSSPRRSRSAAPGRAGAASRSSPAPAATPASAPTRPSGSASTCPPSPRPPRPRCASASRRPPRSRNPLDYTAMIWGDRAWQSDLIARRRRATPASTRCSSSTTTRRASTASWARAGRRSRTASSTAPTRAAPPSSSPPPSRSCSTTPPPGASPRPACPPSPASAPGSPAPPRSRRRRPTPAGCARWPREPRERGRGHARRCRRARSRRASPICDAPALAPRWLAEHETKALLRAAGIPVVDGRVVAGEDDAVSALAELGGPVAVKLSSPELQHKTAAGALLLDVAGEPALRAAHRALAGRNGGAQVLVERMAPPGAELIVAVRRDAVVPALVIGLGGIHAEAFDDVAVVPLPATPERVHTALTKLRGAAAAPARRPSRRRPPGGRALASSKASS